MIIPKEIKARVEDMSMEESADLFCTARMVGSALEKHYDAISINFGIQDGPYSGQSVKVNIFYIIFYFISSSSSSSSYSMFTCIYCHVNQAILKQTTKYTIN